MKKKRNKFLKKNRKKYTGKKLCILLMVVFTLVLTADVANLLFTSAQTEIVFTPGNFDREGGGDYPRRPEGDFQTPEGGEGPSGDFRMPEGDSERPSFEGRPGGNRGRRQERFLRTVRSAWVPILLVCVLGDAVCLILLVRIRRKEETLGQVAGMPLLEEEDSEEPARHRRGPWGAILCLVVAFAMILAMMPTEGTDVSSVNVSSQVISGTAEAAQIQTTLSGAGTLEADNLTPVTVPQQVTLLQYHVRNGETVTAGAPLVSVDKTSAASAMLDLSEVLSDLDADLETARQTSNSSYINATAAGRVKKIYAKAGDKVTDVLYQYGALMLLSLDGTMKVTFDSRESLTVGDTVTVQHSGGRDEGRILSTREGKITVTLSDEKAPYGAQASVLDENGETLGQGTLEIGSALKVIGYYGKVDTIPVKVGSKVSVGSSLLTLKETGDTTDYQILLARRNELETQMQKLSLLARTGMVVAEKDGIVSGVPEDAEIELLSASGSGKANNLSASGSWQLILLSNFEEDSEGEDDSRDGSRFGHFFPDWETPDDNDTDGDDANGEDSGEGDTGNGDTGNGDTGEGDTGEGDTGAEEQSPLSGNYAAYLYFSSGGALTIKFSPAAVTGETSSLDLSTLEAQMTQQGTYLYSGIDNADITLTENGETKTVKLADLQEGDLLLLTFTEDIVTNIVMAQRVATASGGSGDSTDPSEPVQGEQMPGGNAGGMPSGGGAMGGGMPTGSGMTVQKSYDRYISEQTELLYVSDQQEIAVNISVDELDILTLKSGLEAQITLDAMKGQSFTGSIARISNEGTNDGGNTKFTVTVVFPREANMLDGMNASVKVVTETRVAAVAIPTAALVEQGGKTYVYTTYAAESDTLGGLTEVETGASDGEQTEILSGLEAGAPFHYRYADTVTYSFLTAL